MITIKGTYNEAIVYTGELEPTASAQIKAVCDQRAFAGSKIRIMPDVHAGMGCVIGTTMTITDKVVPGMVGVDIGCGMQTARLAEKEIDFEVLDNFIRRSIPCGRDIRKSYHEYNERIDLSGLHCVAQVNLERARRSIGTLGGGNHFIEVDRDEDGTLYLVVHSGSRHIGNEVARLYQDEGLRAMSGAAGFQIEETIARMKAEGKTKEINETVKKLKARGAAPVSVPKDLAYVEGALFDDYLHDMKLIQRFAKLNREAMVDVILRGMGLTVAEEFATIHNYIDTESMILRKGAVSARRGEKLLIPINMRDGSLICVGRGNEDWNYSAPHGAGRLMSRREAFSRLSMEEYKREMAGIFSSCVIKGTLDESPMAYKPMDDIIAGIGPTAEIVSRITPLYNFKAAE